MLCKHIYLPFYRSNGLVYFYPMLIAKVLSKNDFDRISDKDDANEDVDIDKYSSQ